MSDNAIRRLDNQGRVIIPMPLRKALGWEPGKAVELVQENGSLHLRAAQESCAICGRDVEDGKCAEIAREKRLCLNCCKAALRALEKEAR